MTKRLTESQIVGILKEAEAGMTVPNVCRKHGIESEYILQVAIKIRQDGSLRYPTHEGARRRKPSA